MHSALLTRKDVAAFMRTGYVFLLDGTLAFVG
jgi:hypothetical protein